MDFESVLNSNEDFNTNEVNTHVIDPTLQNENDVDRYIRLINVLGLNINITYPIHMIESTICESYMITDIPLKNVSYRYKCYQFKKDEYSLKIKDILDLSGSTKIPRALLAKKIRRVYSYYRYNLIKQKDDTSNSIEIVGFNYKYSGWNSSENLIIKEPNDQIKIDK
jgi:hypothetical protein